MSFFIPFPAVQSTLHNLPITRTKHKMDTQLVAAPKPGHPLQSISLAIHFFMNEKAQIAILAIVSVLKTTRTTNGTRPELYKSAWKTGLLLLHIKRINTGQMIALTFFASASKSVMPINACTVQAACRGDAIALYLSTRGGILCLSMPCRNIIVTASSLRNAKVQNPPCPVPLQPQSLCVCRYTSQPMCTQI